MQQWFFLRYTMQSFLGGKSQKFAKFPKIVRKKQVISFSSGGVFTQTRVLNDSTKSYLQNKTGLRQKYFLLKKLRSKTWHQQFVKFHNLVMIFPQLAFKEFHTWNILCKFWNFTICQGYVFDHNFFKKNIFAETSFILKP